MKISIFSLLLAVNAVLILGSPAASRVENPALNTTSNANPVEITLYYEALCPYCRNFIRGQLYPTFLKLRGTGILKVKLFAHGNAAESWDGQRWNYRCQHGTRECDLNRFTTCTANQLTDDELVPFVYCLENNPRVEDGKKCLQEVGGDWLGGYECFNSDLGYSLQHEIAVKQKALSPRLRFVPWILVNGYHDDNVQGAVQRNMLSYVCNAYRGPKPSACR